jgi:hypothetical protein
LFTYGNIYSNQAITVSLTGMVISSFSFLRIPPRSLNTLLGLPALSSSTVLKPILFNTGTHSAGTPMFNKSSAVATFAFSRGASAGRTILPVWCFGWSSASPNGRYRYPGPMLAAYRIQGRVKNHHPWP